MEKYTKEELTEALRTVSSLISNCEKAKLKFATGTPQHTLLKNRIKALYISKLLLTEEDIADKYAKEELIESLRPISSIINKCGKAQLKLAKDSAHNARLKNIIKAMKIAESLIVNEISKKG
ncbi:hypothetical protein HGA64_02195 [Candidatus Falkowbacteria bacterium]|nr:hypothetical protein [Candidatus Falkowbacteria bacterium]